LQAIRGTLALKSADFLDADRTFVRVKDYRQQTAAKCATGRKEGRFVMPAKSKAQQMAAGAALAAKRGETSESRLKGASRSMAESMTEQQLREIASTKRKRKPEHASKS
jgi:predicted RecA/RadA family phage recombinase